MEPKYKAVVRKLQAFPWGRLAPNDIVRLSFGNAEEFALSLAVTVAMYRNDPDVMKMAEGELNTDNLQYEDYQSKGNHSAFLEHFLAKQQIERNPIVVQAFRHYNEFMDSLESREIAMTIFSRESELPGIFKIILESHDWKMLDLDWFAYYLRRHIELDSEEGGHADLTKKYSLDDEVLFKYWTARLELYRTVLNN